MANSESTAWDCIRHDTILASSIEEPINAARPWFDLRKKTVQDLATCENELMQKNLLDNLFHIENQIKKILLLP